MYYYFYDSFLNDDKYQKVLHRIENRAVDLGINGKIGRGSLLINQEKIIKEEIKKGAHTIIAVGDDNTLATVARAVIGEDVTIGIIPIGKNNHIAKILGMPEGQAACDVLSQRRVKKIDVFEVNKQICIAYLYLKIKKVKNTKISCEGQFDISLLSREGEIYIYNLADKKELAKQFSITQNIDKYFNPQDGYLDLVIKPQKSRFLGLLPAKENGISIVPFRNLEIKSKDTEEAFCANKHLPLPLKIKVLPQVLSVIVGKERKF